MPQRKRSSEARRRGELEEPARLRARFVAHYSGSWDVGDAFDWARRSDADSSAGSPSPERELRELRERLYRPGASHEQAARFAAYSAEVEQQLLAARTALRLARGDLSRSGRDRSSGTSRRRRAAALALVAAGLVLPAGAAVLLHAGTRSSPVVSRSAPRVRALTAIPIQLRGTPSQIAALRVAIRGDSEGPGALVTATALRDIPVLRSATTLSESDLTATAHGVITIPDLDEFSVLRHATVLVFCERATSYDWTMTGYRGTAGSNRFYSAAGRGTDCSGLTYITVPVPPGVHRFTVATRVAGAVRFLVMLQSSP